MKDRKLTFILKKMTKTINNLTIIHKELPTLDKRDVKEVGGDRYGRLIGHIDKATIERQKTNLRKLGVLVGSMCLIVLGGCSIRSFDDQAKMEVDRLSAELVSTQVELDEISKRYEAKKNHIAYLSGRIDSLSKYLGDDGDEDNQTVESNPVVSIGSGQGEYQCIDEDWTTIDDDTNYQYLDDCNVFEGVQGCYIRHGDGKECWRY